jgi:hypothetical protein
MLFLVKKQITVSTKSPKSDRQWVWESEADTSSYTIKEETDGAKLLPRGTSITLHLKVRTSQPTLKLVFQMRQVCRYTYSRITPAVRWDPGLLMGKGRATSDSCICVYAVEMSIKTILRIEMSTKAI